MDIVERKDSIAGLQVAPQAVIAKIEGGRLRAAAHALARNFVRRPREGPPSDPGGVWPGRYLKADGVGPVVEQNHWDSADEVGTGIESQILAGQCESAETGKEEHSCLHGFIV